MVIHIDSHSGKIGWVATLRILLVFGPYRFSDRITLGVALSPGTAGRWVRHVPGTVSTCSIDLAAVEHPAVVFRPDRHRFRPWLDNCVDSSLASGRFVCTGGDPILCHTCESTF